jgi:hypothetical protein
MRKLMLTLLVGAVVAGGCDGDEVVAPAAAPATPHANTRRVTVDQLAGTIPVVTNAAWQIPDDEGKALVDALDQEVLGATLGRPDYIEVTDEPAAVDALYLKLMDDMARNVCDQMVRADATESDADSRELTRFIDNASTDAALVNENLRYLKLRFLGRNVTDDAGVADLKGVFDASSANDVPSGSTAALEGWRGVCIALIKAPAFHIY